MSHPVQVPAIPVGLSPFEELVHIMKILRSPEGCQWDREQTRESLRKYVLEEANEVVEAIDEKDSLHLCEELGDLLMIIVFHAQVAAEAGLFTIREVAKGISDKLISRHPHVFQKQEGLTSESIVSKWNVLKAEEKQSKGRVSSRMKETLKFSSSLQAGLQIQREAAEVGFDFPDIDSAMAKITEEAHEVVEVGKSARRDSLKGEIGDLLFSILNVARFSGIDPNEALRAANTKFVDRFSAVEDYFEDKGGMKGKPIEEMDAIWNKVKLGRGKPEEPSE